MTSATRRSFLAQSAGALAAPLLLSAGPRERRAAAVEPQEPAVNQLAIPLVDTHQHLWDLQRFTLPWLQGDGDHPLRRNFLMADYLKAAEGLNVAKTVYMEVNVHPDQQAQEAEYVLDFCRRDDNPMAAAVIGGSPQDAAFKQYIERFAESPHIKGVRTVLHDADRPRGMCLEPQFVENMKLLGELGLSFDLCMRPGEIADGAQLAEKCPRTRFIIDHCGNMPIHGADAKLRQTWQQAMKAAAGLENVVCKISGIVVTAKENDWQPADLAENVDYCLDTFGETRVFFGGDWPVCTLRASLSQWVSALKSIVRARSPEFQRKLFHDNAVRFYGLA
jgi:predicted TIM-barrel fold metal-dependent hydrolase